MQIIFDAIAEWLKELLIRRYHGQFGGLFDNVNAGRRDCRPVDDPGGMERRGFLHDTAASETVILPIAGLVLTFVMCKELIQLLIERNNLHDIDTWIFFKWIFKTCAILVLSNTFNIVMGVFDMSQYVVQQSAGLIQGAPKSPRICCRYGDAVAGDGTRPAGALAPILFVGFTMTALNIVIL